MFSVSSKAKLLMHFSFGGGQCFSKTAAMTNIYKRMSTLLSEFEFELVSEAERARPHAGKSRNNLPDMISVGISDLATPLKAKARDRS